MLLFVLGNAASNAPSLHFIPIHKQLLSLAASNPALQSLNLPNILPLLWPIYYNDNDNNDNKDNNYCKFEHWKYYAKFMKYKSK